VSGIIIPDAVVVSAAACFTITLSARGMIFIFAIFIILLVVYNNTNAQSVP
jgi:hypothetical protein